MPTKNNSPNLDQYIPEGRKRYVSYYEGAQMYGLAYTGFVKACKEAGANKKIRKTVMVDLDRFEEYLEEQYKEHGTERVRKDGKSKKKDGRRLLIPSPHLYQCPKTARSFFLS